MSKTSKRVDLRGVLAFNIRRSRTTLGVSQEQLAEQAGLHRTYVSQVERGQVNITLESLESLASALDMPAHVLLEPATSAESASG